MSSLGYVSLAVESTTGSRGQLVARHWETPSGAAFAAPGGTSTRYSILSAGERSEPSEGALP